MTPVQLNRHKDAPVFRHMQAVHKWKPCERCVEEFFKSIQAQEEKIEELIGGIIVTEGPIKPYEP